MCQSMESLEKGALQRWSFWEKARRAEENSTWVLPSASALKDDKREGLELGPNVWEDKSIHAASNQVSSPKSEHWQCLQRMYEGNGRILLERDFSQGCVVIR